jgi:trimethylamine:corrinoid methyltransferase-like protein
MPTRLGHGLGGSTPLLKRGFNPDLARFYRLPAFGIGGLTSCREVDQPAAREAPLAWLEAGLAGEQLIHDVAL